eukprot:scaffold4408_cov111-Skeletonema_marinoi.AAC.6
MSVSAGKQRIASKSNSQDLLAKNKMEDFGDASRQHDIELVEVSREAQRQASATGKMKEPYNRRHAVLIPT